MIFEILSGPVTVEDLRRQRVPRGFPASYVKECYRSLKEIRKELRILCDIEVRREKSHTFSEKEQLRLRAQSKRFLIRKKITDWTLAAEDHAQKQKLHNLEAIKTMLEFSENTLEEISVLPEDVTELNIECLTLATKLCGEIYALHLRTT